MKKAFKFYLPGFIILVIVILLFQPNPFLRNALIYTTADITDFEIFEKREVKTGNPQAWNISDQYNNYQLTPDDTLLLDKYKTVAFLLIKDTAILFEAYRDGYSESAYSNSFSMAKSIVSLLIGIAIDEGKISSVNDPVYKYIPEFNDENRKNITIKHLLTMSSGLEWDESYKNPFSVTTKAYYGNSLNKLVLDAKRIKDAGVFYEYSTPNPQLLSIIIKKATNKTLSEYASEKLWKPIGAEYPAFWSIDRENGDEKAFCCFNSNARDFARIGQLVLNRGKWNGKQIISEEYLNESLTPADYLVDENNQPVDFYGYQWWLANYNDCKVYYARGILGQYIICIPEKNMVIVRLGHMRSKEKIGHHPSDLFDYIQLAYSVAGVTE